ncbi:uncharacterized protein LOC109802744 [Cajanus cajan]|nr:uncharacterized protein LOC109802744 [Cajanus cajan]
MGAESFSHHRPFVLGLQPSALVDTVATVDWSLLHQIPGERGGSIPVAIEELEYILKELKSNSSILVYTSIPVLSFLLSKCDFVFMEGHTAQCVCLVDDMGNRTMRPCLSNAVKVQAQELTNADFKGSKWLVLRYAVLNLEVIQAAIHLAKQEGLLVSLDLASFEMVRNFKVPLLNLLESGNIDLCFANEDEAAELLRDEQNADPIAAVEFLSKYCQWAVVTLGHNGCIAKHGKEMIRVPAIGEAKATDATGAGDLFASGFLYGVVKGLSLEECCNIGSCSGGSVIRSLGGEVTSENWQWMYKQMQIKGLPTPVEDVCN